MFTQYGDLINQYHPMLQQDYLTLKKNMFHEKEDNDLLYKELVKIKKEI